MGPHEACTLAEKQEQRRRAGSAARAFRAAGPGTCTKIDSEQVAWPHKIIFPPVSTVHTTIINYPRHKLVKALEGPVHII